METSQTQNVPADIDGLFSIIVPANNEQEYIGACLEAILEQDAKAGPIEVIVAANGCSDNTVERARSHSRAFEAKGWHLEVLNIVAPGKANALNKACRTAKGEFYAFLDADVLCDPELFGQLRELLAVEQARYATGTLQVAPATSWITRRYGRFWSKLPFVQSGAVGAGLFSVNRAGRDRWREFPEIIADDTFVRLQFAPQERVEVPARYHWPMIEGFSNLVKVRKRQDEGVAEIREEFPDLIANEGKPKLTLSMLAGLLLRDPVGFSVYALVHVAVRLRRSSREWKRGR